MPRQRMRQAAVVVGTCLAIGTSAAVATAGGDGHDRKDQGKALKVTLRDAQGHRVGYVQFRQRRDHAVAVKVVARGLTPGFHGFHVHAVGVCDPTSIDPKTGSPFFSAGPHLNPTGAPHREHAGDLPVLLVRANGRADLSVATDRFRLSDLKDADGSAVIIHANPDNFANIPTRYQSELNPPGQRGPDAMTLDAGDSGPRVVCGATR